MNLVKIGKYFKELLLSDPTVSEDLSGKIFPLVAVEGTQFPFLVYRRSGYRPSGNKDLEDEVVNLEIAILSASYEEGVNVTDAVLDAINGASTEDIDNVKIIGTNEEFNYDTYIQNIQIEIYLK